MKTWRSALDITSAVQRVRVRFLAAVVALTLLLSPASGLSAYAGGGATQTAVDRAHAFLYTRARGSEILNYLHMGATYHGHQYVRTGDVVDDRGRVVDGDFALVYRFNWEKDGITDVAFLCNARGDVYQIQVVSTNAILSQPFLVANTTINLLGRALYAAYRDQMSAADRRLVETLIDEANAKGLLKWQIAFEQAIGS